MGWDLLCVGSKDWTGCWSIILLILIGGKGYSTREISSHRFFLIDFLGTKVKVLTRRGFKTFIGARSTSWASLTWILGVWAIFSFSDSSFFVCFGVGGFALILWYFEETTSGGEGVTHGINENYYSLNILFFKIF